LRKFQIYKSTADVEQGTKFFKKYIEVDEKFLRYRDIVMMHKRPRELEMFYDLELLENGSVEMRGFEESFEGIIRSYVFHYKDSFEDVYHLWNERKNYFRKAPEC